MRLLKHNLKSKIRHLIYAVTLLLLSTHLYASDDNIIERVLYKDFIKIGQTAWDNPLQTSLLLAGMAGATIYLYNNENYIKGQLTQVTGFPNDYLDIVEHGGEAQWVLAANSLFFLGGEKEKMTGEKVIEAVAVSGITVTVFKYCFGRLRPSDGEHDEFKPFSSNASFFSGHTVTAFSWAAVIGDRYDIWYITYPLAASVGLARINNNAHWATDVLWGAFMGTVIAKVVNMDALPVAVSFSPYSDGALAMAEYKF